MLIKPVIQKEIKVGKIPKGQSKIVTVQIENDTEFPYNIKKVSPACSCVKVVDYYEKGVLPVALADKYRKDMGIDESVEIPTSFEIKFKIGKSMIGTYTDKIEIELESFFTNIQFVYLNLEYIITEENENV